VIHVEIERPTAEALMRAHRMKITLAAAIAVAAAVTTAAIAATQPQVRANPLRASLNGVLETKKPALGRFNIHLHISKAGEIQGHGDYNGGNNRYIQVIEVTSITCADNHLEATGTAYLNNTTNIVNWALTADDHGLGVASTDDRLTITFPGYTRSGSPVAGKVFIKNCNAEAPAA
jgi:hypothetical protein